jgi:hypothetical protein
MIDDFYKGEKFEKRLRKNYGMVILEVALKYHKYR